MPMRTDMDSGTRKQRTNEMSDTLEIKDKIINALKEHFSDEEAGVELGAYWEHDEVIGVINDLFREEEDKQKVEEYMNTHIYPLMRLYDAKDIPMIDKFILGYYELDDDARAEIREFIKIKKKHHTDPERADKLKGVQKNERRT